MVTLEERGRVRKKKRDIKRAILGVAQTAALIGVAIAIPNLPSALYRMGILKAGQDAGVINRARNQYLKSGLLAKDANGFLRITQKGKRELVRMEALQMAQKKPRRWDERWRLLIFDVPERRRTVRANIRTALTRVGFLRLQDSVWIYPYECEDFIALLKADLRIGRDVLYMIVDEIEGDSWIRKEFGLRA